MVCGYTLILLPLLLLTIGARSDECDYCSEGWKRTCTKECTCNFDFSLKHLYTDKVGRMGDGRNRSVLTYNGVLPGPPIVVCEGDTVTIKLTNNLRNLTVDSNQTTLHLHGIPEIGRSWSDGVPRVNQCPMESGDTFEYGFDDRTGVVAGTYWYHSHVGKQREDGAYGVLIVMDNKWRRPYYTKNMIDDPRNTLIMQEWYKNITAQIPVSILINGNGRVGDTMNGIPEGVDEAAHIQQYLEAKVETPFIQVSNPEFCEFYESVGLFEICFPKSFYTEFDIKEPGKDYRFRLIGAISQNFPLYITVENHTFTAIATDSRYIEPVKDLGAVWISAGERYDILIHTKDMDTYGDDPFKIKVYGKSANDSHLCSIAWLKYPNQTVDYAYYVDHTECGEFGPKESFPVKTLNPVPNKIAQFYDNSFVNIEDLRALDDKKIDNGSVHTHYIGMGHEDPRFNDFSMTYPEVPFLFQSPPNESNRCYIDPTTNTAVKPSRCYDSKYCNCEHVLHEQWDLYYGAWFEVVLINPSSIAHPIHQHGGWYRVVGMGKFDRNITREIIIDIDRSCREGKKCLHRNFWAPPWKDTIQVPTNGYVILRTHINDNKGPWIFHCHINFHVLAGMALVFQIGDGPNNSTRQPYGSPLWSVGKFEKDINKACPNGDRRIISWFLHRKKTNECVNPGDLVEFLWDYGHNVNTNLNKTEWENCTVGSTWNTKEEFGNKVWRAPTSPGSYYFACGVGDGWHCKYGGMKVNITVQEEPCENDHDTY